uniref:ATP synthase subunit d, mitochondrial n=1 Tax=Chelonoidis abingdonii TaxID=106734 RepID=A0A8C0GUD6_CHEAB
MTVYWVNKKSKAVMQGLQAKASVLLHLYRLTSLPEKPPAIDWVYYKTAVAKAGVVDEFEKKVRFLSSIRFCCCFETQVETARI